MSNLLNLMDKTWNYKPTLIVVSIMIVLFFVWASVAQVDQQVRGTGRIIPAGKARTIQHLEGGIVNDILVTEGEVVEEGDILFHIGNQKARSELQEAQIVMDALDIKRLRLKAEQDDVGSPKFPVEYQTKYKEIIKSETDLFNARQQEFREKLSGYEKQLRQKELKLDDLYTRIDNIGEELAIIDEQLDIKKKLLRSGAISRSVYLETESRAKNFVTRINTAKKEVPITKSELQEVYSRIEEEKQKRESEIIDELNNVNLDISKLRERTKALQDEVTRTAVRSPIKGIVNKVFVNTIGGVVSPRPRTRGACTIR